MVVPSWGVRDIRAMTHPNRARATNADAKTDLLDFEPEFVGGHSGIRRIGRTE